MTARGHGPCPLHRAQAGGDESASTGSQGLHHPPQPLGTTLRGSCDSGDPADPAHGPAWMPMGLGRPFPKPRCTWAPAATTQAQAPPECSEDTAHVGLKTLGSVGRGCRVKPGRGRHYPGPWLPVCNVGVQGREPSGLGHHCHHCSDGHSAGTPARAPTAVSRPHTVALQPHHQLQALRVWGVAWSPPRRGPGWVPHLRPLTAGEVLPFLSLFPHLKSRRLDR